MGFAGRFIFPVLLAAAAACSGRAGSHLAAAKIDTLPGGIVRVMSPSATAWADTSGWKLSEMLRIEGSLGDSTVINDPQSLALDGEGRIFVADQNPAVIKVFDRQGRLVRTIGREGGGPGEFRVGFITIHGANLVLHDPRQARTSVFDTSGTFIKSWTSQCCYWQAIVVDDDGLVYIPGMSPPDSGRMYIRYALDGTTRDTLFLPKGPEEKFWSFGNKTMQMSMSIPLSPEMQLRVNPAGGFISGMSDHYEITVSRRGRDTAMVFGRAWSPTPISATRRQAVVDSTIKNVAQQVGEEVARNEVKLGDVPTSAPAYTDIAIDGRGYRWLVVDPGDDVTHTWFDVFDSAGAYLGQVAGPPGLVPWRITWKDDAMLSYVEDEDGQPAVVKYEIRRQLPK